MAVNNSRIGAEQRDWLIAEAKRSQLERQRGYRERALKIHPWVCAMCGRDFSGKKVRELTVHHLDHNHENNPSDGSKWELLCVYCHDNAHSRELEAEWHDAPTPGGDQEPEVTHNPFAGLADLLKGKKG